MIAKQFPYRFLCVAIALAAFLATSLVYHSLLPPEIPEGVVEKLEFFGKHQDEFNTLFLGTSRIYYAVSPQLFDRTTSEHGIVTRTFNFGIDALHPPENFFVLEQILRTNPRKLKWVFVEVSDIVTQSHADVLGTERLVYWHDWPRTRLTLKKALNPYGRTPWLFRLLRLWGRRRDILVHLGAFGRRFTNFGRASDLLQASSQRDAVEAQTKLGPNGDGYRLAGGPLSAERAAVFQKKLLKEAAAAHPRLIDPYAEQAYQDCAIKIRKLGAEPIFVVTPGLSLSPTLFRQSLRAPLLEYNNFKKYPQLFETSVRVDDAHLTNEGSAEFTRLLALDLVRIAHQH